MLTFDPIDGPGSFLPGDQPPVPAEGPPAGQHRHAGHADAPARPLTDIVPPQAMANGGTIIRPGAVAWGGTREGGPQPGRRYSSCEAIERALAGVVANPARLPGLLTELATTRLWIPLPDRRRPFTDGAAVRLPLIGYQDIEFVPCFTSVQRLTAWAHLADAAAAGPATRGRSRTSWRLPRAWPDGCRGHRAGAQPRQRPWPAALPGMRAVPRQPGGTMARIRHGPRRADRAPAWRARHAARGVEGALAALPVVRQAAAAWLAVPEEGAGLVIAVTLDDPADESGRVAAFDAIDRAAAAVSLRVPFPVDVMFPGEPPGPDAINDWVSGNIRPFYARA